jgi:hypothetical protein
MNAASGGHDEGGPSPRYPIPGVNGATEKLGRRNEPSGTAVQAEGMGEIDDRKVSGSHYRNQSSRLGPLDALPG